MESDNNFQGRREFFKEAAKKALPILGVVGLMNNPVIANTIVSNTTSCSDCGSGCKYTCYGGCNSGC